MSEVIVRWAWLAWPTLVVAVPLAVLPLPVLADCESGPPCDPCAKDSEFSWNPENAYVTDRLRRFYGIGEDLDRAYAVNDAAGVKQLAAEYLELASSYRCNWNYGNAVHEANRYLGLLSLKSDDVQQAAEYLTRAGKSTGSPQLDSFGPNLDLANELLKRGQRGVVRRYLIDTQKFWKLHGGLLTRWVAAIDEGETPDLDRIAVLTPPFWLVVVGCIAFILPAAAVAGCFFLKRKRLRKRALYVIVGLGAGYAMLFIAFLGGPWLAIRIGALEQLDGFLLWYLPTIIAVVAPPLVVLAVSRAFHLPDATAGVASASTRT